MHNKMAQHDCEYELSASRMNLICQFKVQYLPKEERDVARGEMHVVVVEEEKDMPTKKIV